jgi:serine/threonine protein kinase
VLTLRLCPLQKLGACLGKGGYGAVYQALNMKDGTSVAVKQIEITATKNQTAEQASKSLMEEISLLKTLSHPRIVRYLDSQVTKDHLHIVLE